MRIPIILQRHSREIKKIEIDTLLRQVSVIYLDEEPETRNYSEENFKDCTLVFTIETGNKIAELSTKQKDPRCDKNSHYGCACEV